MSVQEAQKKISHIVKTRQDQITELKNFFSPDCTKYYKDIAYLGNNLIYFDNIFSKSEYQFKCENILSLSISLGKVLDLNNSVKTLLIALKIFEEHFNYIRSLSSKSEKNFISKMFEKTGCVSLSQNQFLKERMKNYNNTSLNKTLHQSNLSDFGNNYNENYEKIARFYQSLFKNDSTFFENFNKYLEYESDLKKQSSGFSLDDFNIKLNKVFNTNYSLNNYKFYNRSTITFKLDYSKLIRAACDIFFMIYNKMMDKVCYNPNFLEYIEKLDKCIAVRFIKPCAVDLQKLAEFVIQKEVTELTTHIDQIYN